MRSLLARLRAIPPGVRWGGLLTLALLLAVGGWFFFLRGGSVVVPVGPPVRPAVGKTITLAEYQAAVRDALEGVRDARATEGEDRENAVKDVVTSLEQVEGASIVSSTGQQALAEADNTRLLQELGNDDPNLEAVESGLTLLMDSLESGPAGHRGQVEGTLSGAEAGGVLAAVLADPQYDYNRSETPIQRLARWLAELTGARDPDGVLTRLLLAIMAGIAAGSVIFLALDKYVPNRWGRLGIATAGGLIVAVVFYLGVENLDTTFQVLTVVGLVVAAVAAGLITAGLNRGSAPGSVQKSVDLASVLGMTAEEARKRASEAASDGDFKGAIRYRCLALLLALDEAGMLVFDRTATNREYLFRAPGPLHDSLQLLLSRFEEIWYGNSATNAEEWTQYAARAAAIEGQIATQSKAKAA